VDYDREMAMVAIVDDAASPHARRIIGVARFVQNPDLTSAEYAIVVADEWQGKGVGGLLMRRLIDVARRKGLARLEGAVLRENSNMAKFVAALGFVLSEDPRDAEQLLTTLDLTEPSRSAASVHA
jgi:acetyltransferase